MTVILAILTVYRASYAITQEDGPFELFILTRTAVANKFGHEHWLTVGTGCVKCVSFWLAGVIMAMMQPETAVDALVLWGGIAGGVFILFYVTLLIQLVIAKG